MPWSRRAGQGGIWVAYWRSNEFEFSQKSEEPGVKLRWRTKSGETKADFGGDKSAFFLNFRRNALDTIGFLCKMCGWLVVVKGKTI